MDAAGVRLGVRVNHKAGMGVKTGQAGKRVITIDGPQFMGRFLQHVLPSGFKRIRHYGLLSPALKTERMAAARAALNLPAASAPAREDAAEFLKRAAQIDATRSPHCALGRWRTLETLRSADVGGAGSAGKAQAQVPCRGPP